MSEKHSLVGKTVKVFHSSDTGFPYYDLRVLSIEGPFIQFGAIRDTDEPRAFWVPVADCKMIEEV